MNIQIHIPQSTTTLHFDCCLHDSRKNIKQLW